MTKFISLAIPLITFALWMAFFAKNGFTIEGMLAMTAYIALVATLHLAATTGFLVVQLLRVVQATHETFKQQRQ